MENLWETFYGLWLKTFLSERRDIIIHKGRENYIDEVIKIYMYIF